MLAFHKKFSFGTKAETLERLAPLLERSSVPDFVRFTVAQWRGAGRDEVLRRVRATLGGGEVIVRSSALCEDAEVEAQAGAFLSVPHVAASDAAALAAAVDSVIASYRKGARGAAAEVDDPENQILVQRMVGGVLMTGVLLTQDLNTGAPYYVVNYDDESGRTDTITAGSGYCNRTLYVFRGARAELASPRFRRLLDAVAEIEERVGNTCLDVEFALGPDLEVHVFQVRQITTQPNWNRGLTLQIQDTLARLREALAERYGGDDPDGLGGAVLGNMPDWNPAEIIGTTPRSLAFSLYRRLITDRAWRVARGQMGYRERRGVPLMTSLAGQPYIDVRESFRSFLPASLPLEIGEKLVRAWLERLRGNHHLHDKVEFDVALTAFSLDFDQRLPEQGGAALAPDEAATFRAHLRALTNDFLTGRVAPIDGELARVEVMARRRAALLEHATAPTFEMLSELLEDAIDHGTVPFAVLARHGFIATTLLRSLVARGALGPDDLAAFQRSVPTVATEFVRDVRRYVEGGLPEAEFLARYGHLRPGTYDILSLRYDQRVAGLTTFAPDRRTAEQPEDYRLPDARRRDVDRLLAEQGLELDAERLLEYCRAATQGREYAKFVFTHNVSDALEIIVALGARHGLSREELSHLGIGEFLDAFIEPGGRSIEAHLRALVERGREAHRVTSAVRLPSLIDRLSSLVIVPLSVEQPNFITRKRVRGEVVLLQGADLDPEKIDGRIVAIQSADPGFDWIFSRSILGLITRYGGANSHMAIRCAEFALPAAIGCGEQIFERAVHAGRVELDCAQGQILNA